MDHSSASSGSESVCSSNRLSLDEAALNGAKALTSPDAGPPVPTPRSPQPHKRPLRHQSSLTEEENNSSKLVFQHSSQGKGENDGTGEECQSEASNPPGPSRGQVDSLSHSSSGGGLHKPGLSISGALSQSAVSNGVSNQRPPAIRSNSSSSSLFTTNPSSGNKEGERYRPRRGAMVSCENLLSDGSELFGSVPESTLKSGKNSGRKMYRSGGGIFSNPFKSDSEKMDLLTDLLKQYRENGIPDPKRLPTNKLNHLRASSLSISGFTGVSHGTNQPPGLLSANKTSLSTTDLHHMNHSAANIVPFSLATAGHPTGQVLSSSSFDASDDSNYYLESEWGAIVENADQLPARVKSQNEAIWELLHTEVFYIRRLKVINDIFVTCLLNLQSECILNEIDAKNVFSNIGQVFEANHHFWMNHLLPMLNYSRETKSPLNPAMLEDGFLQFDQIFRPYIQYCLEHSSCLQYLKEKRKSNVLFKTYILWCENHKDCERLRLMDLLVKPMQRLTKYSLLLKAIFKKTDNEMHKEALKRMDLCVERFVMGVNATMYRQQEHERLSAVVSRIDSYDAVDCNNDEAEKLIKDYLYLDLMQSMPGCSSHKIRHLYLEDSLKLKDSQSNKMDVHCFLFTDIFLVCKPLNKKNSDSKVKVIRQPFITDRLIVRELKDGSGFLMIYLNELNVACTFLLLYTSETRIWVDSIKKAQEDYRSLKYSSEQEFSTYQAHFDEDEAFDTAAHGLLGAGSPRSSSRSSLIHSHSGSQDMTDQPVNSNAPYNQPANSSNQLAIQQQPPRAVSFELGDLRNPSLVVEDAESFARSQSVDNRSPVVTVTSPRPERRAFLLRNNGGKNSSSSNMSSGGSSPSNSIAYLSQNSLSVSVPCAQPNLLPVQPHPMPRSGRRSAVIAPNSSPGAPSLPDTCAGGYANATSPGSPNASQPTSPSHHSINAPIQVAVHAPPPSPPPNTSKRSPSGGRALPPQISATPPPPPPSPPSLMSISSRGQPGPLTMTINKPPLVKTKNVSCGIASMSYAAEKVPGHVHSICDQPPEDDSKMEPASMQAYESSRNALNMQTNVETDPNEEDRIEGCEEYLKSKYGAQPKRTCRPDRRYHTADSIEHMKKEKDNSIHKRLSWNYGQHSHSQTCGHQHSCAGHSGTGHQCGQGGNQLLHPRPLLSSNHPKCLSNESVYSSSGFSSTGSVALSVASVENNCDQACSCCNSGVALQKCSQFDEEEEDQQHGGGFLTGQTLIGDTCSDRDSALPTSPAMNAPSPVCYHSHTNSQCSVDSTLSQHDSINTTSSSSLPPASYLRCQPRGPASSDIKIDVSEVKDGISSVQITLGGSPSSVTRPSKADLKKMKEFLLSNCNVESSEV